jgi:hypothetical protein
VALTRTRTHTSALQISEPVAAEDILSRGMHAPAGRKQRAHVLCGGRTSAVGATDAPKPPMIHDAWVPFKLVDLQLALGRRLVRFAWRRAHERERGHVWRTELGCSS